MDPWQRLVDDIIDTIPPEMWEMSDDEIEDLHWSIRELVEKRMKELK